MKKSINTIYEKNTIINNIIDALITRDHFLILGHKNPDEDCIASMIACAIIIKKFYKDAKIYLGPTVHEHYQYLLNICKYNAIQILTPATPINGEIDTIIVCDTPKPSMINFTPTMESIFKNPDVLKIEVDHHIGGDSEYIGDKGYHLVSEASSASELVGLFALKLRNKTDILKKYQVVDPLSRNLILAILSGIIGDSKMGNFLKSRKEERFYNLFSRMFNELLARETIKRTNFFDMNEVFTELERLSGKEEQCFNYMIAKGKQTTYFGYLTLSVEDMEYLFTECECDNETVVSMARSIADELAEKSSKLSLVTYFDNPEKSNLIQFRIRRSKSYKEMDLREVLELFSIENGGGHAGAIGFRIPRSEIEDIDSFVQELIEKISREVEKKSKKK
ncbi:MAG: hypothetical protein GY754_35115 [bacterium]|nr:hypothetical protein [bacterium]